MVRELNADKSVHGILVQMPLPAQVREAAVLDTLDPAKDVDALTPTNAGLLLSGRAHLVSCTPAGVMMLLKEYVGDIAGLDALVIGRSLLFGKPAAQLLLAANATVTMAHSRTRDLPAVARRADILVAAVGRAKLVTGAMRIGISARLAKTATAALGDKEAHEIELLWPGLSPPYLDLFAWLEGRAEKPVNRDPAPFRPVMLAQAIEDVTFEFADSDRILFCNPPPHP